MRNVCACVLYAHVVIYVHAHKWRREEDVRGTLYSSPPCVLEKQFLSEPQMCLWSTCCTYFSVSFYSCGITGVYEYICLFRWVLGSNLKSPCLTNNWSHLLSHLTSEYVFAKFVCNYFNSEAITNGLAFFFIENTLFSHTVHPNQSFPSLHFSQSHPHPPPIFIRSSPLPFPFRKGQPSR